MTDTAVLERPTLARTDDIIGRDLAWLKAEKQRQQQAREPISDERLAQISGISEKEANKLLIAREFESTLRGMEDARRATEKVERKTKPSDPGGNVVGLERNAAGKLEIKGLWEL